MSTTIPELCPACDEPVEGVGWDEELEVCTLCAETHEAEDAQNTEEWRQAFESEEDPEEEFEDDSEFEDE